MKSPESTLWTLKQHLCAYTLKGTVLETQLQRITRVARGNAALCAGLQDLGAVARPQTLPCAETRKAGLAALTNLPSSRPAEVATPPAEEVNYDPPAKPRSGLICHLPKVKKRPRADEDQKPATLTLQSADPTVHCAVCHWRYPAEYSGEDKRRHRDMARTGACQRDVQAHTESVRAAKHARRMKEREKLMNGSAEGSDVKACPHCSQALEGKYGPYKQAHITDCAARCIDKELNKIVGESALIPKKKREKADTPDPFAICFKSLQRRNRPLGPELA